jgi:cytidylate kinase
VAVVTISRQYGAGGLTVAPAVADALGFTVAGRELVEEAARRLGFDPELAKARDERTPAVVEEVGMALAAAGPSFGIVPPPPFLDAGVNDRALAESTRDVIRSLAAIGGYVILGRAGQAALADRPDACHLSLVGDLADRAARIARSQGVDEREARARCEQMDAERAAYVRKYYGVDIRDPLLYDCVLNTSRMGSPAAIEVAVTAARRKLGL